MSTCIEQLKDIKESNILCEPAMRNTAPCIAYASFKINNINPEANIIVAPSDHLITNENEFTRIVNECFEVCSKNSYLLTLGIKPSRPDTGYGYIQYNEENLGCEKNKKSSPEELVDFEGYHQGISPLSPYIDGNARCRV